ncbi:MAG: bifunctional oligoribonuclease/PAP phosphatase NrnA [Planctomycetota bacterium]
MNDPSRARSVTIKELAALFQERDDFLFTTHMTPDGDGLGSQLALLRVLKRKGKSVRILNCSGVPEDLRFLTKPGEVVTFHKDKHADDVKKAKHIVAFDLGGAGRLGRMELPVRGSDAEKILIDHHVYDGELFDLAHIAIKASSSAEITYDVIKKLGGTISADVAEPLYVGLVQDTGSFNYNSTSARTHLIAAEFVDAGVNPYRIWKKLNCQKPYRRVRLMGENIARIRLENEGRLATCKVDLDFLKKQDGEVRDAFEVVNHFLTIKGVEVGVLGLQIGSDRTKFSLRATGAHDVCKIAQGFGGGGHRYAAGFTVEKMGFDVAFETVLQRVRDSFGAVKARPART